MLRLRLTWATALMLALVPLHLHAGEHSDTLKDPSGPLVPEVNHLYLILEQSTIDSIANTRFIREDFATLQQSHVDAGGRGWSGTYLIGQDAYLELFVPGAGYEESSPGEAGLGLSTRRLGQFPIAKSSLLSLVGQRAEDDLTVRVLDQDTVSWYYWLALETPDSCSFYAWLMEYAEEFLRYAGVEMDTASNFSRHDYLMARFSPDNVGHTDSTIFDDVISIDLELNTVEYRDLELMARACGVRSIAFDDSRRFDFENCVINVMVNDQRKYCVLKVVCSLTSPSEAPLKITFGPDAELEIEENRATWHFGL